MHARDRHACRRWREPVCDYEAEKLSLILRSSAARGRHPIVALETAPKTAYDGRDVRGKVVLTRGRSASMSGVSSAAPPES
jgi:hypothetical protein